MTAPFVALALSLAVAQAVPAPEAKGSLPSPAKAPAESVKQWATEVAGMFMSGKLDGIAARFDPRLATLLSPEAFKDGWVGIEAKNGKLKSIGAPVLKDAGPLDIAVMAAAFEKVEWTLGVAFDVQGRITSLRFTPMSPNAAANAPPPVEYRAPPYAEPKKFRDSAVKFGDEKWPLPGTISMPAGKGPFPGVVLVHGSGPLDQDETVGGTKVFRDLAWGLASQGIAVLRYDKRTRVHGDKVGSAPMTVKDEVIDDALAAVATLRQTPGVNPRRIAVLGHSLGGYLVPRIAAADKHLAGVIALAGSTRPVHELIQDQLDYLVENGAAREEDVAPMRADAAAIQAIDPAKTPPAGRVMGAPPSYWLDLKSYKPAVLAHLNAIPILVLQGGRDYQVTSKDLDGWKKELAGDKFATFKVFPRANHFFVYGEGKSLPVEVMKPGNVDGEVVQTIAKWVKGLPPAK